MKRAAFTAALVAAILAFPAIARAISTSGTVQNVPYVIGFTPYGAGMQQPFVGELTLNFRDGIISGTYNDESINPKSPFANRRNVPVSGGASNGHVTLIIGGVTFRGTMRDEWMSGSATIKGRIYTFEAEQGRMGKPSRS